MPKMGNSVESCIIVDWKKAVGDTVTQGDTICEVETDKAVMEVESTESGTLLGLFFDVGDEVPVQTNIAAVGEPGEAFDDLNPNTSVDVGAKASPIESTTEVAHPEAQTAAVESKVALQPSAPSTSHDAPISPRAKHLVERKGLDACVTHRLWSQWPHHRTRCTDGDGDHAEAHAGGSGYGREWRISGTR